MPTHEEQRVLNRINQEKQLVRKYLDRAGWTGFSLGCIFTTLLFILVFIPIAQQEALNEQEANCYSTVD
jgi:hypothetical protein